MRFAILFSFLVLIQDSSVKGDDYNCLTLQEEKGKCEKSEDCHLSNLTIHERCGFVGTQNFVCCPDRGFLIFFILEFPMTHILF
jgi:hypothetical protein